MDQTVGQATEVREALVRLLGNPAFAATPRQRGLLEFVVEETLAGRANRIKAFTIATSLFGRDSDFDPQKSSIVRVEALRLRRILESFYAGPGSMEPLQFRLNPGSYVPQFTSGREEQSAAPATINPVEAAEPVDLPDVLPPVARTHRPNLRPFLMGASALSLIGLALTGAWLIAAPTPSSPANALQTFAATSYESLTNLMLEPLETAGDDKTTAELARNLTSDIQETLSLFENPKVIEPTENAAFRGYRLTGRLAKATDDKVSLSMRMTRRMPDRPVEIVWSGRFDNISAADLQGGRPAPAITVAKSLSQTYGAIFADLRQQVRDNPLQTQGFGCVVLAYDTLDEPTNAKFREARACLKRALVADDDFASGMSALAYLDIAQWQYGMTDEPEADILGRVREMTRQAVRIAPTKGRMHAARFWARFVSGRYEDAFQSAKVAMDLNPFASDTVARVGAGRLLRGEIHEGRRLLEQSAAANETRPSWQDFFLFFGAFMEGDMEAARRYSQLGGLGQTPLGMLSQIVVAQQSGDQALATLLRAGLRDSFPTFAADVDRALERWRMEPEMRAKLIFAAGL